jgi:hypothetical protein
MMAKMPATTRITAMIHNKVPMTERLPLCPLWNRAEWVTSESGRAEQTGRTGETAERF